MLRRLWLKLQQPVHVGAWMARALRCVGRALVRTVKAVWTALEYIIGDDAHWKIVRRLLAIAGVVLLGIAARYGWLVDSKLSWLVALFEPILGVKYPGRISP